MKTNLHKLNLVVAMVIIAIGIPAQPAPQKTCIKIQEIMNGKSIKIDTCFTGMSEAEIDKQLNAMGITDMRTVNGSIDSVSLVVDKEVDADDSATSQVIVINDGKEEGDDNETIKVISGKDAKCNMTVVGNNGFAYTKSADDENDSVKTEVVVKSSDKNGNSAETKILIYRKIEVKDVSDSDILNSRSGIPADNTPFTGLKIYPNPASASITISYSASSSEPLVINIYDTGGKIVYTEKVANPGDLVNKTILINSLDAGVYFVNLLQGKQSETKKILVK